MKYIKQVINELFKDNDIKRFILDNNLSEADIINNLQVLNVQKENNEICKKSPRRCLDDPAGMRSELVYENGKIDIRYFEVIDTSYENNLERMFFPNIDDIETKELFKNEKRSFVFKETMRFVKEYKKNNFTKGLYIHGQFGTGKTFILQRLALTMAKKNVKVIIAYYPDLVRMIKSSIASRDTEVIINKLKNVDILMLDDIGAETNTNFIRDEVLGPILQYRMNNLLPVCMTSNLSLIDLEKHFQDSTTSINLVNSERIISRIRYLMNEVYLDDKNYRDNIE